MSTILFNQVIFGPVHSRRLGLSLGVNLLPLNNKLCNVIINLNYISTTTEEISKRQARAIYIDRKSVVCLVLWVRNKCSHCVGNASINNPIIQNFLRLANVCF